MGSSLSSMKKAHARKSQARRFIRNPEKLRDRIFVLAGTINSTVGKAAREHRRPTGDEERSALDAWNEALQIWPDESLIPPQWRSDPPEAYTEASDCMDQLHKLLQRNELLQDYEAKYGSSRVGR